MTDPGRSGSSWPPLSELRDALAGGTVRAVDLLDRCRRRITETDPGLRAIAALDPSADAAARDSDRRISGGTARALDGIPVLVKDNIDTAGLATTAGSRQLTVPPERDADVVSALRAAGAVIVGKTTLTEWGNFRSTAAVEGWSGVSGQTVNAFAPGRSPWGSSSGSAVAVAVGMAPIALGTETDGSVVCPASVNGVVGVVPGPGTLSLRGVVPISPELDRVGVLGGSVPDVAIVLAALGVPGAAPPPVEELRLAYWPGRRMDPDVAAAADAAVERLVGAGATVTPVELGFDGPVLVGALDALIAEFRPALESYLGARRDAPPTLDALIAALRADPASTALFGHDLFDRAAAVTAEDRTAAGTARATARAWARAELRAALGDRHAVIAPTGSLAWALDPSTPPPVLRATSTHAALAGSPIATVPMGTVPVSTVPMSTVATDTAGRLPAGLSVFGPTDTATVTAVATTVADVLGPRPLPPTRRQ